MRAVVAGGGGMLGSAFLEALGPSGIRLARDADPAAALAGADLLINCAADTRVDAAEADEAAAHAVNAVLAGRLAAAAQSAGAGFVHVSSTGCYGAWKDEPYTEADPLRPTTAHHRTKAEGEALVLAAHPGALVIRTGWLFGGDRGQPKNFVWKRIVEADGRDEIACDDSQRGNPTFVGDLVSQVLALATAGRSGVYNAVGEGVARRSDYVRAIVEAAGLETRVVPAPAGRFARPAPVSPNEGALNARLDAEGLSRMRPWRVALADYVAMLTGPVHA